MSEEREAAPGGTGRSGNADGPAAPGGRADRAAHAGDATAAAGSGVGSPSDACPSDPGPDGPVSDAAVPDGPVSDGSGPDGSGPGGAGLDDPVSSDEPFPQAPRTLGARAAVAAVRWYQVWISPNLLPSCRFMPSCSAYAVEALTVHGAIRGIGLTVWRLLRCAPWHPGGWDPVPPPRGPGRRGPEPSGADPAPTDPSRIEGL